MLHRFEQYCSALNRLIEYLVAGLGLTMALLVALQVFCRYALNHSLFWSEELARYLLVWLSFLGATVAYYRQVHPGIDALTSRMPHPARHRCRQVVFLISIGLFMVMICSGIQFAWFVRMQISPALAIPKWYILSIIPLSGTILLSYALHFLLHSGSGKLQ